MKSSEFMRGIIDTVFESTTSTTNEEEMGIFIPPLQQKIELLKKAVGVNNVYSDDGSEAEVTEEEESDEDDAQLKDIKRIAGINPAATDEMSDDEPLES